MQTPKGVRSVPIEWARYIGGISNSKEMTAVELYTKPNENDVYPLSIHLSPTQKVFMASIRMIVFLLCLYACVPYDLYITNHNYRLFYWGTDLYSSRVSFVKND